ncbi:hypothetical protein V1515DRAFT_577729 [Lipomyces mesembrius]
MHYSNLVPQTELVAVCTIVAREIAWANENIAPAGVTVYDDYDEMSLSLLLPIALKAIAAHKHCRHKSRLLKSRHNWEYRRGSVKYPHLKVMCGFRRRFDASYRDADANAKASVGLMGPTALYS